jgi:hypothetical protein
MDFEERLEKAIERGHRTGHARSQSEHEKALSDEELKRLHSQYRLQLSEHIERCLSALPGHFPGFRFETVVADRGWGAAVSRDDLAAGPRGRGANYFSRLEMLIRPFSSYGVLELTAKGTIRNRELFNRSHYQRLTEVDPESFIGLIDLWVLEFAELYAAKSK